MDRIELIQYLIHKYEYKKFLEIGTQKGKSFFPIKCRKKIAVDPNFQISFKFKIKWYFKNIYNWNNSFYKMTSNDFFNIPSIKKKLNKLNIVLIDGLHTYDATLNDTLNTLKYLTEDGIIILHDCFPPHAASSIPAKNDVDAVEKGKNLKGWTGEWCGDSWKAIVYLRKKYSKSLDTMVLDTDYGLGVVKIKTNDLGDFEVDQELFDDINKLSYTDLITDPNKLIGLSNANNFKTI